MTEEQLNKEWLRKELKGFSYSNEFLDKILDLLSKQYINGLEQSRFEKKLLELENQELKNQLEVGEEQYNDLVEEKEKIQEELSSKILQLDNQQKEFIEYLENEIDKCKYVEENYADGDDMSYHNENELRKDILSKYKEIMRCSND